MHKRGVEESPYIDEQRQISRVAPQADLGEFEENGTSRGKVLGSVKALGEFERFGESGG